MERVALRVGGMNCAACSAKVQRALAGIDGVAHAQVAFATAHAVIEGDELDADTLIGAVESAGYEATAEDPGMDPAAMATAIERQQTTRACAWRRRAIIGLALWVPAEAMHWGGPLIGLHAPDWVMLAVSSLAMLLVGSGFLASAWSAARRGTTNMDTLISMGAGAAWGFSTFIFVAQRMGVEIDQPLYFTEAAALLAIISLGHWIEARSSAKAGTAVRELLHMQPEEAEVLAEDGSSRSVPTAHVTIGDRLVVRPGARIAVDGTVIDGRSDVDESIVTGEPLPVARGIGDEVIAGSMNASGRLVVEATVDGRHTTVARIAALVTTAQSSRADIERLADRVSSIFVPVVLTIAAATIVGWYFAGDMGTGIVSAVTVLVISCPCALGLATPMAVMVGTGEASLRGILVKDAAALEAAGRAVTCIFDKTGTLTRGKPVVSSVVVAGAETADDLLLAAAAVEAASEHPIGKAIVAEAAKRGLQLPEASAFHATPGVGVAADVDGKRIVVARDSAATCRVERDGDLLGRISVEDEVRDDAAEAVASIEAAGLTVHLLSGDRRETSEEVADRIGIDAANVHAEASPAEKTAIVADLPGPSVMVGDGINDAAALAMADVGIAIAGGTNVAMESASIVIPSDRIGAAAEAIALSRATLRTIRQNLFFAFLYNAAAIPLAALGLLGARGPLIAAAAMGLSDITVIGNALRLKRTLRRDRDNGQ